MFQPRAQCFHGYIQHVDKLPGKKHEREIVECEDGKKAEGAPHSKQKTGSGISDLLSRMQDNPEQSVC